MPQPVYRHFSDWQREIPTPGWLTAAACHQQRWGVLPILDPRNFVTREQFLACIEQAKNHSADSPAPSAGELVPVPVPAQDEAERQTWDKERRLAAVRHCYANKWGDKGRALAALVDIWKETKDAAVLLFRIPCHRLKCRSKEPYGCDSCWAMGRIADLLAEHYEAQQILRSPANHGRLLRQRVHVEVGQGSMLAWLVLRALRTRKQIRTNPPWHWERAYADCVPAINQALRQSSDGFDCVDNVRVARADRRKHVKRYWAQAGHGCCGSHDDRVTIGGVSYLIGFNYGH